MAGRLQGKRVVVTDASEFMGPDIVPDAVHQHHRGFSNVRMECPKWTL